MPNNHPVAHGPGANPDYEYNYNNDAYSGVDDDSVRSGGRRGGEGDMYKVAGLLRAAFAAAEADDHYISNHDHHFHS